MKNALLIAAMLATPLGAIVGGYYVFMRQHPTETDTVDRKADYAQWIDANQLDDQKVRTELLDLITTTTVNLSATDKAKVAKLTFNVDDVQTLLEIDFVGEFVSKAASGQVDVFAFLTPEQQAPLKGLLGSKPTPLEVRNFRSHLVVLAAEFANIRQKPDWKVEVSGEEKVALPMLDLLREGYEFMPADQHPTLKPNPVLGVFTRRDADLIIQLSQYFNGPRAKAAFPPEKFAKVYTERTMTPIPTALIEYGPQIEQTINAEKKMLLPGEKPPAAAIEAVNDVYIHLERFLAAVYSFGK